MLLENSRTVKISDAHWTRIRHHFPEKNSVLDPDRIKSLLPRQCVATQRLHYVTKSLG